MESRKNKIFAAIIGIVILVLLSATIWFYCNHINNQTSTKPNTSINHLPSLYFKQPYYLLSDGTNALFPVTLDQVTTAFAPTLPAAATDVDISFYWSQLCPTDAAHCDFSLIDKTLTYWAKQNKGVILSIQVVSYPTKTIQNGKVMFISATPPWVMKSVATYIQSSKVIGQVSPQSGTQYPDMPYSFPTFWDPTFVADVKQLITTLGARYDGNPAISHLRMGFGFNGEDLTFQTMPDLSPQHWITDYESPLVTTYLNAFKKTPLEFDMAFLGHLKKIAAQQNNQNDQTLIDGFVNTIISRHILHPLISNMQKQIRPLIIMLKT
jgi:hypothetical protein